MWRTSTQYQRSAAIGWLEWEEITLCRAYMALCYPYTKALKYWLEMGVSFLGFLLLDNLVWSWEASACSKLGQVGFKEAVLPQTFVTYTKFIFAFSLKLSVLTTFVLFFRMVSSPAQLEQWTIISLFCGCYKWVTTHKWGLVMAYPEPPLNQVLSR